MPGIYESANSMKTSEEIPFSKGQRSDYEGFVLRNLNKALKIWNELHSKESEDIVKQHPYLVRQVGTRRPYCGPSPTVPTIFYFCAF